MDLSTSIGNFFSYQGKLQNSHFCLKAISAKIMTPPNQNEDIIVLVSGTKQMPIRFKIIKAVTIHTLYLNVDLSFIFPAAG